MIELDLMGVRELRQMVRRHGWKGASVLGASKAELIAFLMTADKCVRAGSLTLTASGQRLVVMSGKATIVAPAEEWRELFQKAGFIPEPAVPDIPENPSRNFQERRSGRPAAPVPTGIEPLLKTFRDAERGGVPFYRTGKRGLYCRRAELPEEYRQIGRDRLEGLLADMIQAGKIVVGAGGKLGAWDNALPV